MSDQPEPTVYPDDVPESVAAALEKMKTNIRTLGGIIKKQTATISELTDKVTGLEEDNKASKIRKVTGDPELIAITLHLVHKKGMSIQAASEVGVLSYSKTYGVYSWPEDYRMEWLEEHDMMDVYEDPIANSAKAKNITALK